MGTQQSSIKHPRRARRITALAALALVAGTASATAAVDPDDKVYAADLPQTAEVAAIYPVFVDGSREVLRNRRPDTPTRDCLGYRQPVKAADGKWSYYLDADGEDPYFAGYETPGVFVYKFSTRADAKAAYKKVKRHHVRCEGRYEDTDGTVVKREVVTVPDLGAQSFAIRTYNRFPNVITTWSYSRMLDVFVRDHRYLVKTMVQAETFRPKKGKAVDLTEVVLTHVTG